MTIGYLTEPVKEYGEGVACATTLQDLRAFLAGYRLVAADALAIATTMPDADWPEFRRGLKQERRGVFAGEPWATRYAAITMPGILFRVSMVAMRFKVPWGLAYIRCREAGRIIEQDGVAVWQEAPQP